MTHGAFRPTVGRTIGDLSMRLRRSGRGQSLTELALILPVILLLTVIALDFGRIYLGYINVQNMARIAANYAANNPLAWGSTPDTTVQLRYRNQVIEDMGGTNCALPVSGGAPVVPSPTFTHNNLASTTGSLGDIVTVRINCSFAVATPMISGILGGSVQVTAESNFPVKAGMTSVVPAGTGGTGGGVPTLPSAAFVANMSVFSPTELRVTGPSVVVDFRNASGGGIVSTFDWDFGDGAHSANQDAAHAYQCATASCTFLVDLKVCNSVGCTHAFMNVIVIGNALVNFAADRQVIDRGQTVTFTDQSSIGGTAWNWYLNGTLVGSGQTFTQTFNVVGTYTVKLVVTYPERPEELTKVNYITVSPGYCPVPSLLHPKDNWGAEITNKALWFSEAQPYWTNAGFTGTVRRAEGAPKQNDFKITEQSIAAGDGATAICTSDVFVGSP